MTIFIASVIMTLIVAAPILFLLDVFICVLILDRMNPFSYELLAMKSNNNKLYLCSQCNKLSRKYQREMYYKIKGSSRCPHCNITVSLNYSSESKQEKWMHSHPDCPKASFMQLLEINTTTDKIIANQKVIKSQEFYEKYNDIKADFSWIENLQRVNKER